VKRIVVAVVAVLLVVVLGAGAYTQLYLPSQRDILTGAPPASAGKLEKLTAEPLRSQPPADRERFSTALHDAVATIKPDYRIENEELYVRRGGYDWAAVRNLTGDYLSSEFGFSESADAQAEVGGETVDYLVWQAGWLRRPFDDRVVVAVALRTLLEPDYSTMVFGYFVMRPE